MPDSINRHSSADVSLRAGNSKSISLIHQPLEDNALARPDAAAFIHGDERLTCVELYQRVCALAHTFCEIGVKRGDRVGLFAAKGLDTTIGLYAAMAAGGAYVPLDPHMPVKRLAHIIEDCDLRVFVCDERRREVLNQALAQTSREATIVGNGLDRETAAAGINVIRASDVYLRTFDGFPNRIIVPGDLAYVMYTSGSTGAPKGLMHTHSSGLAYARLSVDLYSLTPSDRLANMAPLHFDQSTLEYLASPLAGACTVIVDEEVARFPSSVTELMEREHVSVWYSVPHAMVQMLRYGALDTRDLTNWRWMLLGGERIPVEEVNEMMRRFEQLRVVNVYGPAEVNQCTHYELPRPFPANHDSVPIGQPWADTEALVVDDKLVPVKPGESGELLIRTTTMMQGYWGQEDLTRQVFHDEVSPGGFTKRFLRTGDLVREHDDGQLLFLGRRDRQVKLRGYRIELDEIETVVSGHDGVAETAVVMVTHPDRGGEIHARVTQLDNMTIDVKALRKRLAAGLPRYAIPAEVAVVTEFPRTTSLKVNRRQLVMDIEDSFQK